MTATPTQEDTPTPSSPPSFGICVLDASTAEFQLSHFTDDACRTELETLIRQLKPKEIIHQKGNLSVSTLRLLRSCVGVDCQWTALKEGKEFLRPEDAKDEVEKLFKEAAGKKGDEEGEMEVDGEEQVVVPENIRLMYEKPVAMSALGGMVWCVSSFPFPLPSSPHRLIRHLGSQVPSPAQPRLGPRHR